MRSVQNAIILSLTNDAASSFWHMVCHADFLHKSLMINTRMAVAIYVE
jgi:hypothetical protein